MIRVRLKYASFKGFKKINSDLRRNLSGSNKAICTIALENFGANCNDGYLQAGKSESWWIFVDFVLFALKLS